MNLPSKQRHWTMARNVARAVTLVWLSISTGGLEAQSTYTPYTFTHFAGGLIHGTNDGTGSAARFYDPGSAAVDSSGSVYVTDSLNHTIRKITPTGEVTTFVGLAGREGRVDGAGSTARFSSPIGVTLDTVGNVYVGDTGNSTVRKITPLGDVTTLAGHALSTGSADGTGSTARFNLPRGVATDASANVYVADGDNNTIRKITPEGVVTTLAGLAGRDGSADGTGAAARFDGPRGVAIDASNNVYVADFYNNTIRKITPAGEVTTFAGLARSPGGADGAGSAARFYGPYGVAADAAGNLFVTDALNQTIRKITPAGVVTTLAGLVGSVGSEDGTGSAARFYNPQGLAVDASGTVYLADTLNNAIRTGVNAGPLLSTQGWVGSGQFQITFNSVLGTNYNVQYSTVLTDWVSLRTVLGTGGPMSFVDPNATDLQRFYRVTSP